jgi:predicted enzyme related to lactoylglutathione lyase
MANRIVWFDVPALDLERAMNFYSKVLDAEISEEFPGVAVMSHGQGEVAGCVFKSEDVQPSDQGTLLYFNVDGRLDAAVAAVEDCGGTIKEAAHPIGEFGHRAIVIDSEGNRIALHSE